MITAMIAASLYCQTPKIRDNTGTPWTEVDQRTMQESIKSKACEKYNILEPCLIIFQKNKDGDYTAVCGPEVRRD